MRQSDNVLYSWETYSFRNYPLYGRPRVQHKSRIVTALQWVWAKIARKIDRYRLVEILVYDVGVHYEYKLTFCDRGSGPWKRMSADEMLQFAEFIARAPQKAPLKITWEHGMASEILDIPKWATPHVRHALMRAVFHHLTEGKKKEQRVEEQLRTQGYATG